MKKFTLIELLIVVAIIGILLSILLPSLVSAREKSKRVVCLSNLKQQFTAGTIYAKNNNLLLPDGKKWKAPNIPHEDFIRLNPSSYEGLRDNYLSGVGNTFYCPNSEYPIDAFVENDHYLMGYFYLGGKPFTNSTYNYELPIKLSDSPDLAVWGDVSFWTASWGGHSVAPHTKNGFIHHKGTGARPNTLGAQGSNFVLLNGSAKWYNIGNLDDYYQWSSTNELQALLPKDMW